jgi:SAM-dependent methyltransferase
MRADARRVLVLVLAVAGLSGAHGLAQEAAAVDTVALRQATEASHAAGDYAKALASAEALRDALDAERIDVLYRIAGLHALLGRKEQAYAALQQAFDAGFWDFAGLRKNDDFKSIRDEERFRAMARKAWSAQYIAMLERDEREEFQKPAQVMETLAFRPGERVADVGAGSGYFTVRVARAVGPTGWVLAIDIRQEMLDYVAARLASEKIGNVRLSLVQPEDPQLPPGGIDTVLMVDTIHYVKDLPAYAKKLRPGLAEGGRVVIIDYRPKPWAERPWGPPPEQQVPRERIDEAMAAAGLKPVRAHEFLPEQYFVEYAIR